MAESIQKELEFVNQTIATLEQALPLIVTPSKYTEGIELINQANEFMKEISFDPNIKNLSTTLRMLNNGDSPLLQTVTYQSFLLEIIEMLNKISITMPKEGVPKSTSASDIDKAGEFLMRMAGRVTHRYKLNIQFEEEYEAKSIRAFMVLKELEKVGRFLNISPDISTNPQANLDSGLEIDLLSQEPPATLHKLAGSVLEVKGVQIFTETKNQPVMMLDPPDHADSFDRKVQEFLTK